MSQETWEGLKGCQSKDRPRLRTLLEDVRLQREMQGASAHPVCWNCYLAFKALDKRYQEMVS